MISFFLGVPGSGKSYYGVYEIYKNFSPANFSDKYINCYTNINEFQFNKVRSVYKFDDDDFMEKITKLYELYRKKVPDKELHNLAKELNLYKTLFVLDECHKFFDVERKVLVWWLTYHRHLYHDIILITQSLSLLNSKYKPLAEAYYKAKSRSLTLFKKSFKYMYYATYPLNKGSYVNTISLPLDKKVFELYKSGDSVKSKNVIKYFLTIAFFLFIFLIALGYYFYYLKEDSLKNEKKSSFPVSSFSKKSLSSNNKNFKNDEEKNINIDISNLIYMRFLCNVEMCSYQDLYFDLKLLSFAKKNFNLKVISSRRIFNESLISVSVDKEFISFLKGGDKNEEVDTTVVPFNFNTK